MPDDTVQMLMAMQRTLGCLEEAYREGVRTRDETFASIRALSEKQDSLSERVQEVLSLAATASKIPDIEQRVIVLENSQKDITPIVARLHDDSLKRKGIVMAAGAAGGIAATSVPLLTRLWAYLTSHGG